MLHFELSTVALLRELDGSGIIGVDTPSRTAKFSMCP